ncbi:MAG TPA: low-complexity tail membrane protein [Cyanophyceae cyanobacterium]
MRSFWTEPFLWIHLAGLAALPLTLEVVWLGLAIGTPLLPGWLEFLLVAVVGIAPVLWMQLTRPFDIFSILIVAMKPEQLTQAQRKILRLLRTKTNFVLAIAGAVLMVVLLWQIYRVAPVATPVAPFPPQWHLIGLLGASIAFLASHLFLQVPLSVAQVLFASESDFAATEPYPVENVSKDFTIPGVRVNKILPLSAPVVADSTPSASSLSSDPE